MGSRHTKLTMEDYWPWLKPLRIGGLTNCKHKSSRPHQLGLRRFRNMKSSSSRQVCGAQELSQYHFCFDYRQSKASGAADALSRASSEEPDLTLPHQVFICGIPVLSWLHQFWRCLMAGRMSRELCITKACPTFLRSSEWSWLAGITMRALCHREDSRTCCQEILWRPAVTPDTYSSLEKHEL